MIGAIPTLPDWLPRDFLAHHWQRRPLLLRQAFPGFQPPLEADELAGLACEANVESRIVIERDGDHPWQVLHGPFGEQDFSELPASHWTLLVQDVDKHDPDVATLLDHFRFIPDWRIDDIMISYAAPGGSVGPHIDQYDVFLLQAHGQRRWMIDSTCRSEELLDGPELRILADFEPDSEWLLEPGDMLYLPPGIPHHGIAEGDCMTISIGFRAPTDKELLGAIIDRHLQECGEHFHSDPGLPLQQYAGEIRPKALKALQKLVEKAMHIDEDTMNRYLCEYLSETKPGIDVEAPEQRLDYESFLAHWQQHGLVRALAARILASRQEDHWHLHINGETFKGIPRTLFELIDRRDAIDISACPRNMTGFMYQLYCKGYYVFDKA